MSGFDVGDLVKIVCLSNPGFHCYHINDVLKIDSHYFHNDDLVVAYQIGDSERKGPIQMIPVEDIQKVDEDMAKTKSFRNGDVIKIEEHNEVKGVFVKFGENYYDLYKGGTLKAHKYLPPGMRTVLLNLSGMGEFFLKDEEELESTFREESEEDDRETGTTKTAEEKYGITGKEDYKEFLRKMEEISKAVSDDYMSGTTTKVFSMDDKINYEPE